MPKGVAPKRRAIISDRNARALSPDIASQVISRSLPPWVRVIDPGSGHVVEFSRDAQARQLARLFTVEAVQALVEVASDRSPRNASARVTAASAILDRGWGKPVTPISQVTSLPDSELRALAEPLLLARLGADPSLGLPVASLPGPPSPPGGGTPPHGDGIGVPERAETGGPYVGHTPHENDYTQYNGEEDEQGK